MADKTILINGTLYRDGLDGFRNDLLDARKQKLPFQCFPIYLNDDAALDRVIRESSMVDLGSALFVPNDVSDTNIVWVIFQNVIGKILNDVMTYQEWRDFIFENDLVLPVNLQVNNYNNQEYVFGKGNVNTNWVGQTINHTINGEVEVVTEGQNLLQYAVTKGHLPLNRNTQLYQIVDYVYQMDGHTTRVEHRTERFQDYSNTVDVYCYNGRVEMCADDYDGLCTFLAGMGKGYSDNVFNRDIDAYTDDLNNYLDNAVASNDDESIYGQETVLKNYAALTQHDTVPTFGKFVLGNLFGKRVYGAKPQWIWVSILLWLSTLSVTSMMVFHSGLLTLAFALVGFYIIVTSMRYQMLDNITKKAKQIFIFDLHNLISTSLLRLSVFNLIGLAIYLGLSKIPSIVSTGYLVWTVPILVLVLALRGGYYPSIAHSELVPASRGFFYWLSIICSSFLIWAIYVLFVHH